MKKAVIFLCVLAVLLAAFGAAVTVSLVKSREELAWRYFDQWVSMHRMTELLDYCLDGTLEGSAVLLQVNHEANYGLVNWSTDTDNIRLLLQDYETLLRIASESQNPQQAENCRELLAEINGKMQQICREVLDACPKDDNRYTGGILPEDPAVKKALESWNAMYAEYLPEIEKIIKQS